MEAIDSTSQKQRVIHPGFYRQNIKRISRKIEGLLSLRYGLTLKPFRLLRDEIGYPWLERPIDNVIKEYFDIQDLGSITPEERRDIYILLSFMMKRTINSLRQFQDTSNTALSIKNGLTDKKFLSDIGGFLPIHDSIHGICRYVMDPKNQKNDPQRFTPAPFRIEYTGQNDTREMLEEELLATIWIPGGFRKDLVGYIKVINNGTNIPFWQYCVQRFYSKDELKNKPGCTDLVNDVIANPHPKVVEMYEFLWKNRENPRVLLDLFLKETRPLVEGLRRRKVYQKI